METMVLFRQGKTIDEIARTRGITAGTISGHLATAIQNGEPISRERFFTPEQEEELETAFRQTDGVTLGRIRELLGGRYGYEELRLFRAFRSAREDTSPSSSAERL